MRIYVVHPGVPFSTADTYAGVCAGLRANGAEVIEGRLDEALQFQSALYEAGQAQGVVTPGPLNMSVFTSPYIVQHAIATQPDVVLVVSAHNFNIASAKTLRLAGLRTAVLMTESPYFAAFERTMAQAFDVVFTHEQRAATPAYFDHPTVHYLPHAWNPLVHQRGMAADAYRCDVLFVGTVFAERKALFEGVDWSGITLVQRGYRPGQGMQDIVENRDTAAYYRSAAINLNHHRTTTEYGTGMHIAPDAAESLNPRAYEIAACGGFQLMDDSRAERFTVFGDTAPTYRAGDSADLERQVRHYLARPDERRRCADAMHAAVQPHSWTHRAHQLMEYLA